jgi:hypothetical protein
MTWIVEGGCGKEGGMGSEGAVLRVSLTLHALRFPGNKLQWNPI